jgi:hypothetical protein
MKKPACACKRESFGATKGIRTLDLTFTKRLLYRLSYGGE